MSAQMEIIHVTFQPSPFGEWVQRKSECSSCGKPSNQVKCLIAGLASPSVRSVSHFVFDPR